MTLIERVAEATKRSLNEQELHAIEVHADLALDLQRRFNEPPANIPPLSSGKRK